MGSHLETEILVHIAAPAGARDDEKYRALAHAYLGFEPVNRTRVPEPDPTSSGGAPVALASPQLSFSSAWDNLTSPKPQNPEIHLERTPERVLSGNDGIPTSPFQTPPSVVPDSFPDNHTTIVQFASPTRILEFFLSAPAGSPSAASELPNKSPSNSSPQRTRSTASAAAGTPPQQDVLEARATGHAVDCGGANPSCINQSDIGPSSRSPNVIGPHQSRLTPSCAECLGSSALKNIVGCGHVNHSSPNSLITVCPNDPVGAGLRRSRPVATAPASSAGPLRYFSRMEVCAPEPLVGTGEVKRSSILTPKLAKVYRDMGKAKTLGRLKWKRKLREFERGYWMVDISVWRHEQKTRTWQFLANYVGKGEAGWGVRCRRDESWSHLRIWCFGSVVAHLFLVLYVASRKDLLSLLHVSWIAADGDAVVVMQPRGTA